MVKHYIVLSHLGVFYTALSRATTLGDANGLNSAFYLIGENVTEDRIRNIGKKKDSYDYYTGYVKRSTWVRELQENKYDPELTDTQLTTLKQWMATAQYSESDIQLLLIQRQF